MTPSSNFKHSLVTDTIIPNAELTAVHPVQQWQYREVIPIGRHSYFRILPMHQTWMV